ncbi:MAG TPA: DUF4142 domain-containing protein [Candidatus Baltobacteraceae bacterium]|jgi:predicted outer membrane protein|nr:DUF4142 domain-containing protein [Candidatus Baltobacteraceae bacterium]
MKRIRTGALLAAGFMVASTAIHAGDLPAIGAPFSHRDGEFVQNLCDDSLMVQRIGELANQRSQNTRIKQVGLKIAEDYGKTKLQFAATAQSMGTPITAVFSPRASRTVERLQSISSGMDFDRAALRELFKSQQSVLLKLEDESDSGNNPALKQLAASTLPQLQNDIYQVSILQSDASTADVAAIGTAGRELTSKH